MNPMNKNKLYVILLGVFLLLTGLAGCRSELSPLQPVRDLALEAGVNPNTVQRAYAELERDGLVNAERTSGRFVTADAEKIKQLRGALSSGFIGEMFKQLQGLGLTNEEIIAAVQNWGYSDK